MDWTATATKPCPLMVSYSIRVCIQHTLASGQASLDARRKEECDCDCAIMRAHTHRLLVAKQALDLLARVDAHLPSQPRQLLKPKAHRTALRYAAPLATERILMLLFQYVGNLF